MSPAVSPKDVESCVGKLFWIAFGRRHLLSTLNKTFSLLDSPEAEKEADLLAAMKKELSILCRLLPLFFVTLHRQVWTKVLACDASEVAGGIAYTHTQAQVVEKLISTAASRRITLKGTFPPHLANHIEEAHPAVESFVQSQQIENGLYSSVDKKGTYQRTRSMGGRSNVAESRFISNCWASNFSLVRFSGYNWGIDERKIIF